MFRHTSKCSQALSAASPDIPDVDGKRYRYIDTSMHRGEYKLNAGDSKIISKK
jgi:hypothetical protein